LLDAACETNTSYSTASLPQQPLVISSDVGTQNDDVTSDARTSEVEMPQLQPVAVPAELLSVDSSQPVAVPSQLTSVVDSDVDAHVDDDGASDVRTDYEHNRQDEELDTGLDETLYHDCIGASFAG